MSAWIVVDLGFGDAGKGSLVDFLVREHGAHTVVRFNGGAQAAHNVVLADGTHHTFSQFGSGTFVPGVRTHLSRFMLVDPAALVAEERHLRAVGVTDAFARLSVDRRAIVVTPFQKAANRLREMSRGDGRHGSCGMGIGETMADFVADEGAVVRVGELLKPRALREKMRAIQARKLREVSSLMLPAGAMVEREMGLLRDGNAVEEFARLFREVGRRFAIVDSSAETLSAVGNVVFEGAQGVLLDEWHGFHPYTTWSTTTFENAETLLAESGYAGEVTRVGAMRAYMTRHGAGPFVTEDAAVRIPEMHNRVNDWQHGFRAGWMDLMMMRYALEVVGGVDGLAVTCLDHLEAIGELKVCVGYEAKHEGTKTRSDTKPVLRVDRTRDLEHQERMGKMLMSCEPVYERVERAGYVDRLEERLGVAAGIESWGATWADKRVRVVAGG
jgi:adenylosuccinate synthase